MVWEGANAAQVEVIASAKQQPATAAGGRAGGWVNKPYTVALPGNAGVLSVVRQLQGSSMQQQQGCCRKWWVEWAGASTALVQGQ